MTHRPDADPSFTRWAAAQRPPLSRHPLAAARIEHAALLEELAAVDGTLEVLCARRRVALAGLSRLQPRLWPGLHRRHGRRRGLVDQPPLPPVPADAVPVDGTELRELCLGILRRHGTCALRELHGLIHRHGYVIESSRPVQRLADAMAYEVRQGRCRRVERGVYAAVPAPAEGQGAGPALRSDPLPWSDPDLDRPQLDPVVIDDPERWSEGAWPASAAAGRADAGEPAESGPVPAGRYPDSDLDELVHLARVRAAALAPPTSRPPGPPPTGYGRHTGDDPVETTEPETTEPETTEPETTEPETTEPETSEAPEPGGTDTPPTAEPPHDRRPDPWERFVDESFPSVRIWAARRRLWEQRWRRRQPGRGQEPPSAP